MLTVGSLFAGIGGIEYGLERTGGFKTVWQVENDKYATRVLERHWPGVRRWGDVRTFPPDTKSRNAGQSEIETENETTGTDATQGGLRLRTELAGRSSIKSEWAVDLICGGFPCQDISYAGKGAGLDGERSGLWYEFARVVRVLEPRYVLVENVSALLTRGLDAVLGTLASLGYDAEWHCIPAAAVGAPHIRDRVFVVGYAQQPSPNAHAPASGPRDTTSESSCDVSDAKGTNDGRGVGNKSKRQVQQSGISSVPSDVPDAEQVGRPAGRGESGNKTSQGERWCEPCSIGWWSTEPDVGRVADGIPARVDRLRCLGNAVVPAVAQYVGNRILEAIGGK